MKTIYSVVGIDADKCNGDKLCVNSCPTGAIWMNDKKANIDKNRCSACKGPNPAVKALVVNYCLNRFFLDLAEQYPTIFVGEIAAKSIKEKVRKHGMVAHSLAAALTFAKRVGQTDNVLVFDGSFGHINLTSAMGAFMMEKAPEISKDVDQNRLPRWLMQRGIDPGIVQK